MTTTLDNLRVTRHYIMRVDRWIKGGWRTDQHVYCLRPDRTVALCKARVDSPSLINARLRVSLVGIEQLPDDMELSPLRVLPRGSRSELLPDLWGDYQHLANPRTLVRLHP